MSEDVVITIEVREESTTEEKFDMAGKHTFSPAPLKVGQSGVSAKKTTLNLNLDTVEIKSRKSYIVLKGVDATTSSVYHRLNEAEVENGGHGNLLITMKNGYRFNVNAEALLSHLIKATDLPVG